MHQIYPDQGLLQILLFWRQGADPFIFNLFANDFTPDRDTVLADLTPASYSGYAPINVAASAFTLTGVAGHKASAIASPIAFPNTTGAAVDTYGYYFTDTTGTFLMGCARFDAAPVTTPPGESTIVTPVIGAFSEFAS